LENKIALCALEKENYGLLKTSEVFLKIALLAKVVNI
jgi:hypothetical protein